MCYFSRNDLSWNEGGYRVKDTFLRYYDEIVEKAFQKAQVTLTTHQRLLRNYEQVYKNFTK